MDTPKPSRTVKLCVLVPILIALLYVRHIPAGFDSEKIVTLEGVVSEFEWTSWYSQAHLMVYDPKLGLAREYAVEMGSPQRLTDDGWTRETLPPGSHLTVTINPRTDGSYSGMYLSADLPDGRHMVRTGPKAEDAPWNTVTNIKDFLCSLRSC